MDFQQTQLYQSHNQKIYENSFIQLQKIGQGGFASVYRVVHKIDDTEYAVKQIHLKIKDVKDDLQKHYEKLIREARYLAQVNHPNVIRYFHSWIEVTEKKKSQKQEEQKMQTMELSNSFTSKKKNSQANVPQINGVGIENQELSTKQEQQQKQVSQLSPKKVITNLIFYKQQIGNNQVDGVDNKIINIQSINDNGVNSKIIITQNLNLNNSITSKDSNDQKDSIDTLQQKQQQNNQLHSLNSINNQNTNQKSTQNQTNSKNDNSNQSDDEGNEDSNTFFFQDEDDGEVVFEEENSKSINKDDTDQDVSGSSINQSENGNNHNEVNEQQEINNININNDQVSISNTTNKNNNSNKSSRSFQLKVQNGSNGNSIDMPNDKKSQQNEEKKLSEFQAIKGNNNDDSQENKSHSFNKNLSDFQLVIESYEDSQSNKKEQGNLAIENGKKRQYYNDKDEKNKQNHTNKYFSNINNEQNINISIKQNTDINNNKNINIINQQSLDNNGKEENSLNMNKQLLYPVSPTKKQVQQQMQKNKQQDQNSSQQLQEKLQQSSAHSTKSHDRRKNKSMDYLTIGQKQREFQLDKYDEIIFYLQTELCQSTLAEYITNRNKKLFNMSSMNQIQLGNKSASKNNSLANVNAESNHCSQNQQNLNCLSLTYSYSNTYDPYDILTPEYKQQAILLLKDIIKGLYHIHHICKMVHRDLKPHNIFLTENMQVKIGDFGLVKKLSKLINPNQKIQYNDHQLYGQKNDNSGMKQTSTNNSFSIVSTSPSETNSGYHDKLPFYLPKEEITSTCGTATYASPEQLSQKVKNKKKRIINQFERNNQIFGNWKFDIIQRCEQTYLNKFYQRNYNNLTAFFHPHLNMNLIQFIYISNECFAQRAKRFNYS